MASSAEPAERQVDEIESLCMNCHEDGTTRLLLTRIPFFREVVIMSFECPHCHFRNNEIQSAGEIQQRGVRYDFKVGSIKDLQRQVVKSDTCTIRVEDIDLEIPPGRGQLTNLEGLLSMIREDLAAKQDERRRIDQNLYQKIEDIIKTLADILAGSTPCTVTLNDPAGNSSLEPSPSDAGGKYKRSEYPRSGAENAALGLAPGADNPEASSTAPPPSSRPEYRANAMLPAMPDNRQLLQNITDDNDIIENEVYSFPASCPGCTKPCATNMKMVRIPHFDEVIIMSTVCHSCGYRSNEVKTGGKVPDKGRRITLQVECREDLSRDILKSESCALECPELSLTVEPGTLGGRFTTVEGLLTQVRDDLRASIFDTDDWSTGGEQVTNLVGDSMPKQDKVRWSDFFAQLDRGINGEVAFTLILQDPLASSYVQSLTDPDPDPQISVEEYERTEDEEEQLGLRDIKTGTYGGDDNELDDKSVHTADEPQKVIDVAEIEQEVRARLAALATDGEAEKQE